jgi:hypothetical protein
LSLSLCVLPEGLRDWWIAITSREFISHNKPKQAELANLYGPLLTNQELIEGIP